MTTRIERPLRTETKYPQSESIPSPYDPDYMNELEAELQRERAARQAAEAEVRRLREQLRLAQSE